MPSRDRSLRSSLNVRPGLVASELLQAGLTFPADENFRSNPFPILNLQFTIDKNFDLGYHFVCYLEQTSLTAPAIPALTLDLSISCSLFCFAQKVNSFGTKQIQPLFAK